MDKINAVHHAGTREEHGVEIYVEAGTDRLLYRWWDEDGNLHQDDLMLDIPRSRRIDFETLMTKHYIQTKRDWSDKHPFIWDRLVKDGEAPEEGDAGA